MSDKEEVKPPGSLESPVGPIKPLDTPPPVDERYRCGTLEYTKFGLLILFGWLIWGGICFNLFEGQGGPSILNLYLQDTFHVSNFQVNMLFMFIPNTIGTFMTPIVSFKSDRTRSRFGRRMPYILFSAPFLVMFAIAIGYSDDIILFCKTHFMDGGFVSPLTAAMAIIGFITVGFSFFNEFVGTVFYYIVPDVVPKTFIGRFQGIQNIVNPLVGIAVAKWITPIQLTHMKEVHVGMAILYFVSFTLICLMVKEGKYPPVTDVTEKTTVLDQVKLYFRECFTHPIFILFYLVTAVTYLSKGFNPSGIFQLHLSQHQAQAKAAEDVESMAMTSDGKWLISGGKDGTVKFWSSPDMKDPQLIQTLSGPGGGPAAVAMTQDGKKAVSTTAEGDIAIWDTATGKRLGRLAGHSGPVHAVAISPDEKLLASAGEDGTVRVWDLADGSCLQTLQGHEEQTTSSSPSAPSTSPASSTSILPSGSPSTGPEAASVNAVAFSSDSLRVVSGGCDKKIRLWDARKGTLLKTIEGSPGPIYAVLFAPAMGKPDEKLLPKERAPQAAYDSTLGFLQEVFRNESMYNIPLDQYCKTMDSDGWIISGGRDGTRDDQNSRVRIWDVEKGQSVYELKGHRQAVRCLAYKPDLRVILSGGMDGRILLWQPWPGKIGKRADDQSFKTFSGYTHAATALALPAAGVKLVNSSTDGTLHVWNIDQGISLAKGGLRIFMNIFAILIAYPIGMIVDKYNPIRLWLWTHLALIAFPFLSYLYLHDYMFEFVIGFFNRPIGMLAGMVGLPVAIMIYPKSKYGQMSSAGSILKQVITLTAGPAGAIVMDRLTASSMNTDFYRYGYLAQGVGLCLSFACLLGVYYYWKKMGAENYVAPET